ncbi:TatD DNase family protein [Colwellia chukchiensis]|uniref:TatD DNase family protein n=1 Tax=Colwellia chukchiensis TaxID=641665 RepID=A0A1H7G561_9GAMM|nr:TatD family hydrolase [Colwellia chukchiensis]SEK33279.1 TatD DNase family protein [Colwellia chukchiensis]
MKTPLRYSDSHCHLDFDAFAQNRPSILAQCQQANIHRLIIPTIGPSNWQSVIELVKTYHKKPISLHPCLGIHPWFLDDTSVDSLCQLEQLVKQHIGELVAIGEAGIDGVVAKEKNNLSQQIQVFEQQLNLAKTYHLPIIVHHRRSHQQLVPLLRQYKLLQGGIIHAFSGSYQQACQYLDLGFKLGIGGTISYPRAQKTINAIKRLPLDCFVIETDAPAMPLHGFQGQNNSPLQLVNVFQHLANIRQESPQALADALEQNLQSVLKKLV